jgi:hypothetical protein
MQLLVFQKKKFLYRFTQRARHGLIFEACKGGKNKYWQ